MNITDGVVKARGMGGSGREERTGPDGKFSIPDLAKSWVVLILGDDAFAIAGQAALAKNPEVQAVPYGRVEGSYLIGRRPAANTQVELSGVIQNGSTMFCTIFLNQTTTTDPEGRFAFKDVIPAPGLRVAYRDRPKKANRLWMLGTPAHVEPGRTIEVTLGGKGRPLVGRVEPPQGWAEPVDFTEKSLAAIETNRPWTPYPLELFRGKTSLQGREWSEWSQRWRESPEGIDYQDRREAASVTLAPDGSFRIDDVPPGEYRLVIRVNEENNFRETGPFARIVRVVKVPPAPGGRSDVPLDLGVLRLRPKSSLKAGDPLPEFEVTTVDGRRLVLPRDYRGKFLLIDFGTMWDMQSALQITRLNEVHQKYGEDERFAILSLLSAADDAEARRFVEEKGEAWPQAIIGPMTNPITAAFGVHDENVPAAVLIGPDGKVIARDLWYQKIGEAVGEALKAADK